MLMNRSVRHILEASVLYNQIALRYRVSSRINHGVASEFVLGWPKDTDPTSSPIIFLGILFLEAG